MVRKKTRAHAPATPMAKADIQALAHFRYQLRRFLRFSEEVAHEHGVTPLQYLLLLQIRGYPGRDWATITELAERLQAQHHGVVSLVSRCEAAGLVRRSVSTEDRRCVEVRLTAKGKGLVDVLANLHRVELLSFRGALSAPEIPVPRRRQA
ncbi:putative HTH-type transcriptional regulator YusO [Burkholderiales bacterium]|nr:putative HTH-type transcriptional regulator YusO [Burkholderiales bacterium]